MNASSTVQLSVNDFAKLVQNRRDLYEAVLRSGYYLPKFKSTMITEEYMHNVITAKTFCTKFSEVTMFTVRGSHGRHWGSALSTRSP
jgi:hypothetical protein